MALNISKRQQLSYQVFKKDVNANKFIDFIKAIKEIESFKELAIFVSLMSDGLIINGKLEDFSPENWLFNNESFNSFSFNANSPQPVDNSNKPIHFNCNYSIGNEMLSIFSQNIDEFDFQKVIQRTNKFFPKINQLVNEEIELSENDLKKRLEIIQLKWNQIDFSRFFKPQIGEESIENLRPVIDDIYSKIVQINEYGISGFPKNTIVNFLNSIQGYFNQVITICDLDNHQFINRKQEFIKILSRQYEIILSIWSQIAAIISLNLKSSFDENINNLKSELNVLNNLKKGSEKDRKAIADIKVELEGKFNEFQNKFKNELSNFQLINEKDTFNKRASDNKINSRFWIIFCIIITLVLFGFIYYLISDTAIPLQDLKRIYIFNENGLNFSENIIWYLLGKTIFIKFLIISILIYILNFGIKNYNSERHNYVVNMHKVNSLNSSLYFFNNSIIDDATKNEIIKLASQAVFVHQNSGFLGKESDTSNPMIFEKIVDNLKK